MNELIEYNYEIFGNQVILDSLKTYRRHKRAILRICRRMERGEMKLDDCDNLIMHFRQMEYERMFMLTRSGNFTTMNHSFLVNKLKEAMHTC